MAVSETTFIFDGHSSTEFGIVIVSGGVHVDLPETRERMVEIPTMDGAWDFGPYLKPFAIKLDCLILEQSRATVVSDLTALQTLLDPHAGVKPLVISDRSGTYYARYSGVAAVNLLRSAAEFTLPFIVPDAMVH